MRMKARLVTKSLQPNTPKHNFPNAQAFYKSLSLRSRRKHKSWGVSPRDRSGINLELATARDSERQHTTNDASTRYHGLKFVMRNCPGAYAPGFTLTPALQAKRLLCKAGAPL